MPFQLCTDKQHTSRAVHYLVARHTLGTSSSVSATAVPCMARIPACSPPPFYQNPTLCQQGSYVAW